MDKRFQMTWEHCEPPLYAQYVKTIPMIDCMYVYVVT